MNGMIEQILWQVSRKKATNSIESCQFYTSLDIKDDTPFNDEVVKAMEECNVLKLSEVSKKLDSLVDLKIDNFSKIVADIDGDISTNQMGVMLYFGDTKVKAQDDIDKEILYKTAFLKHVILGLATV